MKNKRILGLGTLLLLLIVGVTTTYAWWYSGVTGSDDSANGSINISEADSVTTKVSVANQSGSNLVPVSAIALGTTKAGDVEFVDLIFTINWNGEHTDYFDGYAGKLVIAISDVEFINADQAKNPSDTLYSDLARFEVGTNLGAYLPDTLGAMPGATDAGEIILGTPLQVTIRVTIAGGVSGIDYYHIQGADLVFNVTFQVETN